MHHATAELVSKAIPHGPKVRFEVWNVSNAKVQPKTLANACRLLACVDDRVLEGVVQNSTDHYCPLSSSLQATLLVVHITCRRDKRAIPDSDATDGTYIIIRTTLQSTARCRSKQRRQIWEAAASPDNTQPGTMEERDPNRVGSPGLRRRGKERRMTR